MAEAQTDESMQRVRIGLTGLREDGPPLGREVERVVRELLPTAVAAALSPLLGSHDGVLRLAVLVPLYLQNSAQLGWLVTMHLVTGWPLFALTVWLSWLIIRRITTTRVSTSS